MNHPGKLLLLWAAILAALMLTIRYWGSAILTPNTQVVTVVVDGAQQVILDRDHRGHYTATGKINGQRVRFFVDTGATDVAIPERVAQRLGLNKGLGYTVRTANGDATAYHTPLSSVSLGGLTITDIDGAISPGMGGEEVLLGMAFLRHLDFAQKGGQLLLSIPEP